MIRAVGNKRLELNDSEYSYYKTLKDKFGDLEFVNLFSTDKNGIITSVTPPIDNTIHVGVVYFILNVMMNQRIRMLDLKIANLTEKNNQEKVVLPEAVDKMMLRLAELEAAVFKEEVE